MISKSAFTSIRKEVKDAFNEAFLKAMENERFENDFVLFIAHAEYLAEFADSKIEPAVVDYTLHRDRDKGRINFMLDFLNSSYSFKDNNETLDSEGSLYLELMIYCHIWESKPFLRNLKRLTSIANKKRYPWTVKVPDSGKSEYILSGIAEILSKQNLDLGQIIKQGYNQQLRNAFAHSEVVINIAKSEIYLTNYKGEEGQIKTISFEEWTKKFCYSFLLNYVFEDQIHLERKKMNSGKYKVLVKKKNGFKREIITFDKLNNAFN